MRNRPAQRITAAIVAGAALSITAATTPSTVGGATMPPPPTITAVATSNPSGGTSPPANPGAGSDDGTPGTGGFSGGDCSKTRRSCCRTGDEGPYSLESLSGSSGSWFTDGLAVAQQSPDGQAIFRRTTCYDGRGITVSTTGVWVTPGTAPPPPTVDDLVPGVIDEARNSIPLPVLDMSPAREVGGYVNFGMWLAIQAPAPVTARAEAGAVWAQVTATLRATTWNMGNGDIVECEGFGDPIIDPDTSEPSPICGYTYAWPSAPQYTGTDDLAYHLTVTTHWDLQLTGSDGRNVTLDPVDSPLEFTYQVREIQTVGTP